MISSLSDGCYIELSDPSALLCQTCEKQLLNISVLGEKLETMKSEVRGKLSRLQVATSAARKRPGLDFDTSHSSKRCRAGSQAPSHSGAPDGVGIVQPALDKSPSSSQSSSQAVAQDPGPSPDIQVSLADSRSHA